VDLSRDVRVSDEYRWLEDYNDPEVRAWSEAENSFARAWLDGSPQRAAIHARVAQLMSDSSPAWFDLAARKGTFFALESRPPKQHASLVVLPSLDDVHKQRVLVDPDAIDPSGATAIGWFVPTLDGKRVAVSLSKGGGERGDVHVFEVATGKEAKDVVPQADGAGSGHCLAWKGDGSGFFYTHAAREPGTPKDGVYQRVYFHKLGDPVDKDALALGADPPQIAIAQWELSSSADGRSTLARMEYGDGGDYEYWALPPAGRWKHVATKDDEVKGMQVGPDGALYVLSAKGAPRRRLLRTSLAAPALAAAEEIAPQGDAVIADYAPARRA
jgi:prolyl oligopeptidase